MGHHNIRFDGDPHALAGAWSPSNSRANFCEQDYAITMYLAEMINSLTNIAYVYYALRFMYGPGSRGLLAPRWDAMSLSLLVLGIGSFLFHATLRQTLEFADEFSMLGLTWSMLQATFAIRTSRATYRAVSTGLAVCFISFAVFYLQSPKIIYQVLAFVLSLLALIARTHYLYHGVQPALAPAQRGDWIARTWKATGLAVFGYVLWNIDLEFCAQLRAIRQMVGLPWAWLFELHGWWHVLTAMATGQFMDVVREMHQEERREKKKA
ncbi:hypothetical protein E4U47_000124 [Claviceps purpurea]|nr:hypothetical protein E4U47_000124 [Claviceps purpurea]